MNITVDGTTLPPMNVTLSMVLDADAARYRVDATMPNVLAANASSTLLLSLIFDAGARRLTVFHGQEASGSMKNSSRRACRGNSRP